MPLQHSSCAVAGPIVHNKCCLSMQRIHLHSSWSNFCGRHDQNTETAVTCFTDQEAGVTFHFWAVCRSSEQDVTAVVGAVNATTIFLGALYALNVLPVISVERAVYYRERASFFYHSLPFSLAQSTVEIPYIFVQACVYSSIVYWCAGLEVNVGMPCLGLLSAFAPVSDVHLLDVTTRLH